MGVLYDIKRYGYSKPIALRYLKLIGEARTLRDSRTARVTVEHFVSGCEAAGLL